MMKGGTLSVWDEYLYLSASRLAARYRLKLTVTKENRNRKDKEPSEAK
jgi:hypothetical protein